MKNNTNYPTVYAARTDVGCVRQHNEDSFIAQSPLFIVADGMGGHQAGEVASEIAINTLCKYAPKNLDSDLFIAAVKEANAAIFRSVADGIGKPGMGTTLTAAIVEGSKVMIAQVGDSRAYLLHNGKLQKITRDHSLVADLVDSGQITEEEARTHSKRSVITKALGAEHDITPDIYVLQLEPTDRLLLCSDGLHSMIRDNDIEQVLVSIQDVNGACDTLIRRATRAGGLDNVTAIIIDPLKQGKGVTNARIKRTSFFSKHKFKFLWIAVVLILIAGLCIGANAYINSSYYVKSEGNSVYIYQGLPGSIIGISFSKKIEDPNIDASKLNEATIQNLEKGITVDSLDSAHNLISTYQDQIDSKNKNNANKQNGDTNEQNSQNMAPTTSSATQSNSAPSSSSN
ncbi:MAG: Stp1/IreP family PP2C-type Ser/Thr phosphatase [Coriobacteriales bacterium]|nr:Stp1/IreP family PP2C-type Ser/Thr phosphatase [Coriobacteriales bacterium]